jgi:hypothetical protein
MKHLHHWIFGGMIGLVLCVAIFYPMFRVARSVDQAKPQQGMPVKPTPDITVISSATTAPTTLSPDGTKDVPLTDADKIALLRAEAKRKGLRFYIHCQDGLGEGWEFVAWAGSKKYPEDSMFNYAEEGGHDGWFAHASTEAEAAYQLYLAIQRPENHLALHKMPTKPHKQCPPPLRGE